MPIEAQRSKLANQLRRKLTFTVSDPPSFLHWSMGMGRPSSRTNERAACCCHGPTRPLGHFSTHLPFFAVNFPTGHLYFSPPVVSTASSLLPHVCLAIM